MTTYFVRINNEDEYNRAVELLKSKFNNSITEIEEYVKGMQVVASDGMSSYCFPMYDQHVSYYGDIETELFLEDKKEEAEDLEEASVPKFKVGDTIECISDNYVYITEGNEYTVLEVDEFDNTILLMTDEEFKEWYNISDFTLVNETKVVQENTEQTYSEYLMQQTIKEIEHLEQTFDNAMSSVKDKQQNIIDLLKSLTTSDNCFITFEKGRMLVVDTADYLSYNVNSVEEAIVVAQKIDDLRVIEDELKELRGE